MSRIPLREYLRAGTSQLHASLDASVAARGYLHSREGYREFLRRSLVFQSAAEQALESLGAETWIADWPARRRIHLLLDDLRALGFPAADVSALAMSSVPELPGSGPAKERVLGIAYVLEGSTLGAAYVLRELAPLGISAAQGATFLAGGKLPERRWPVFLAMLEAQDTPQLDRRAVLDAARATFSAASREFG